MPILSKCECSRTATCTQCNSCVLHCPCPSADELAAEHSRQIARQFATIIRHIEANSTPWDWAGTHSGEILWDGRMNHVGYYVSLDDGIIWYNKSYADGRGMVQYNYGNRRFTGNVVDVLGALAKLNDGILISLEGFRNG